ncbi:MAG TPA: hypothetical protein VEC92_00575 [Nitrososphaerales archaeon]|nr:hypothetical protein [Nitrososphaerales archaeon]
MVLAGKVFLVRENYDMDLLAEKLKSFRLETETSVEGESFKLLTEISDLAAMKNNLEGVFSFDTVFVVRQRDKSTPVARTYEAPFAFDIHKNRMFLTVYDKKNRANNIANEISKAVFLSLGQVVEARIEPDTLKKFHEANFDDTKIVFYDQVDLPNISKLSLYGAELGTTSLYNDYLTHGKLWYVVIKSKKYGYVVGVTRNSVVTCFSRLEMPEFKSYIKGEIVPLIA